MARMLELSHEEFKIKYAKGTNGYSRQHERTDG